MAHGFKSGGRPRGGKNKATMARERALQAAAAKALGSSHEAFSGDGLCLLQFVYKNPHISLPIRIEAAKAAVAYERPRLAPIQPPSSAEDETAKALRLHQLLAEMRRTVGGSGNGHASAIEGSV